MLGWVFFWICYTVLIVLGIFIKALIEMLLRLPLLWLSAPIILVVELAVAVLVVSARLRHTLRNWLRTVLHSIGRWAKYHDWRGDWEILSLVLFIVAIGLVFRVFRLGFRLLRTILLWLPIDWMPRYVNLVVIVFMFCVASGSIALAYGLMCRRRNRRRHK